MATRTARIEREGVLAEEIDYPAAGPTFTWMMVVLCGWLLGGLYLDGWAHNHGKADILFFATPGLPATYTPPGLPTAPAPWHALFHAGLLAMVGFLCAVLIRNHARGYPWRQALPLGYKLSFPGVVMLAIGSLSDLIWPGPFVSRGISFGGPSPEALSGLLSPSHLFEVLGLSLVVAGPLRAAWLRPDEEAAPSWAFQLPLLLSLTFLLSVLTYMTQFAHPFVDPWPAASLWRFGLHAYRFGAFFFGEAMGVLSIMLQTSLLMGLVLLAVRRWALPPGSLTLIFALNAALMSLMQDRYLFIGVAAAAGLVADLLRGRLQPSVRPWELRLFAFAVPTVYYLLYFLALTYLATLAGINSLISPVPGLPPPAGIGWSVQLWMGTTLVAGAVGWLLSYLVMPPAGGRSTYVALTPAE